MAVFTQRTTAPTQSDEWFYDKNPFHQSGYGMPNCTAYAWGRFAELMDSAPKLSLGNAEEWYGHADGYARGKTPRVGAIICWRKGTVGVSSDGAGHVAIVEQVNDDGSIITSESGWKSATFWWQTRRTNDGNWGQSSSYTFQGFIYHPMDFDGAGVTVEPISANRFLSQAEMENNAWYIWNYLGSQGWSMNAVAGMLGNMQTESTINPGIWESLASDPEAYKQANGRYPGFGLVQWTPHTKLVTWANTQRLDYTEMDTQLERIEYEVANGLQYSPTSAYPETFKEFKVSTKDPYYLGMAFLANYERPKVANQPKRGQQAEAWYEFLSALPAPVHPSSRKRRGLSLLLMYQATKRKV